MSVSILEALEGANMNLDNVRYLGVAIIPLIKEQLTNSIALLEKGYGVDEHIEPLLERYGDVESVPTKNL